MFFIDDIMLSPFKGLMFIAQEVANAADQARQADRDSAMRELSQLHQRLEAGEISEEEFEARETELLDLLDGQD